MRRSRRACRSRRLAWRPESMKIQRFRAKTAQEALEQARIALGPEALILQTRRVPNTGLERLIGRPQVEVLAAIDTAASGVENRSVSRPGVTPPAAEARKRDTTW